MKKRSTIGALLLGGILLLTGCMEPAAESMDEPSNEPTTQTEASMQDEAPGEFSSETIHIGVIVSDLEASLQFYQEVIGMKRVSGFEVPGDLARGLGLSDGLTLNVEVLQLGEGEEATQWKVMSFGDVAETHPNAFIHTQTGMQYITLFVNDLKTALARLEAYNVEMLGETPTQLPDGRHFVLVQDPDGTFIELIGPRSE